MAKIFFDDKQSGDSLTATNVNDIKAAINTNIDQLNSDVSSLHLQDASSGGGGSSTTAESLSNGTVSGYYDSNNQWRYNHHLIPESNANFDLGSAEYKVRHLFLSNNSLWVGDNNKITVGSDGGISNHRIDRSVVPPYIQTLLDNNGENVQDHIKTPNGIDTMATSDVITPEMYLRYALQYNNDATIDDIYPPEGTANYDANQWSVNASMVQSKKTKPLKATVYTISQPQASTLYCEIDLDKSSNFYLELDDPTKHQIHFKYKTSSPLETFFVKIHIKPKNGNFNGFSQPTVRFSDDDANDPAIKQYEKIYIDEVDIDGNPDYKPATDLIIEADIFNITESSLNITMNESLLDGSEPDAYDVNGNKFKAPGMNNFELWSSDVQNASNIVYAYNNNGTVDFVVNTSTGFNSVDMSNAIINSVDTQGYVTSFSIVNTERRLHAKYSFANFGSEVDKFW